MRKKKRRHQNNVEFNLPKYPKDMSTIFEKRPNIFLDYREISDKLDMFSISMIINNEIVCAQVTEYGIGFTPVNPLKYGIYNVKVMFKTKNNELVEEKWSFSVVELKQKNKFYTGIPHCHTSYSSGKGIPEDAFSYAKKRKLDYLIITDHTNSLKTQEKLEANKIIREISRWDASLIQSENFNKKNRSFLPLVGFECGNRDFGHINIYNTDQNISGKVNNRELLNWLRDKEGACICINHPGKGVLNIAYDKELDRYINFIEIGNGAPPYKYSRYEEIVFGLLDKGWHLGVFNSQDNHKDNWGDTENLTVIVARSLNKEDFLEALFNRRVYATESRYLKMKFKLNDYWMGSVVNHLDIENLEFIIELEDKKNLIKEIILLSNNGKIIDSRKYKGDKRVKQTISIQKDLSNTWYLLKVIHEKNKISYSSPIFIT